MGQVQNELRDSSIALMTDGTQQVEKELNDSHVFERSRTSGDIDSPSCPSDAKLLHHTLIKDGSLPRGHVSSFMVFSGTIEGVAEREIRKMSRTDNISAAVMLHKHAKAKHVAFQQTRQTANQFLLAASEQPRQFETRLLKSFRSGLIARRDAETSERSA